MEVFERIKDVRQRVAEVKETGGTIGFVPTMGALHDGHLSLVRRAREECDLVVVSIFVNPTQFGPAEDYERYPRDLAGDEAKCQRVGCDIIFAPTVEEMYPKGFGTCVQVQGLSEKWEGVARPGHFRGVTTIVLKLFNIVRPSYAYFGMKDYQQLKIIQKMVRDLDLDIEIVPCPTVREPDGLAMSSRNEYLSSEERAAATILFQALELARDRVQAGERDAQALTGLLREFIGSEPLAQIDYIAFADPETLDPVEWIDSDVVLLVAVRIGQVRLIDNTLIAPGVGTPKGRSR